jgi:hypothetical protein
MTTPQPPGDGIRPKKIKNNKIYDNLANSLFPSSPSEWRENVKMMMAAGLAIGSWIMLGALLWSHFDASRKSAETITGFVTNPVNKDLKPEERVARVAVLKDAHELVDKTSNSIYVLVMPLATAITGFFFISSGLAKKNVEQSELPQKSDVAEEKTIANTSPQDTLLGAAANNNPQNTLAGGPAGV